MTFTSGIAVDLDVRADSATLVLAPDGVLNTLPQLPARSLDSGATQAQGNGIIRPLERRLGDD